ncbi:MAG: SelR domain [Frankiaceae bacterium]|jgi:peptide methionine sulfoxide reductase MsrB|nr:SelR domain [Frankiaceae bacterium]
MSRIDQSGGRGRPQTPTGDRYCMNSIALTFEPESGNG